MSDLSYVRHEPVSLKRHPNYNEKWLEERISEDPTILGMGDLEVRAVEVLQPKAGRLDMLLRDPETAKRYEVEIMLGEVDESHIIRTIEYWDIERKRYPQYDHAAVIIAEKINARFLNVISLFNSAIPIIAIQLNALKVGNSLVLNFTKVLDEIVLGREDDDDSGGQSVDRTYWENKGSKASVKLVDDCLAILREIQPGLEVKYNKYYIGLTINGLPFNFVIFRAKKQFIRAEVKLSQQEEWNSKLEEAGLVVLPGAKKRDRLIFQLHKNDVDKNHDLLKDLFTESYQENVD